MTLVEEGEECFTEIVNKRNIKGGSKDYQFLIFPYLNQMDQVIREGLRTLRSGGQFHMMISDAALYGVHVPAPGWIADLMRHAGFIDVENHQVRARGHRWLLNKREGSSIGLGEYYLFGVAP